MSKLGTTVSVLALALGSGAAGCAAEAFRSQGTAQEGGGEVEPSPELDGGSSISPPQRLQALIVADRPPPAISGGSLAVTPSGAVAVAADSDRDLIYVIDVATQGVRTIDLEQGSEPGRVVFDGTGGAHVALRSSGKVVRVDLESATVVAETAVCQLPRGLAYDGKRARLLVACASGELVALSAATHEEQARSFLELDLRDVVVGKDGKTFVSRYRTAELLQVDDSGKVIAHSTPGATKTLRFDPQEDTQDSAPSRDKDKFVGPTPVSAGREVSSSAAMAWKTVSAADGTTVMLHQQSQDDEVIIAQAGGYGGGGNCLPITHGGITRYDADGHAQTPLSLGGAALVVDIAVSADGEWLALAKPGAYLRGEQGSVEVLPLSLLASVNAGTGVVDAGVPPAQDAGISDVSTLPGAFDAGFQGFPNNGCISGWQENLDSQTTAVAFDGAGRLYTFSREPAQLVVYHHVEQGFPSSFASLERAFTLPLHDKSVRDTGHELFHADVGTGLACASCHGEALEDGHVWNFRDFGPRRTQNLRGGFLQTLPLHWEGDLPEFQSLVDEVMTRRMGGFHVETKYASALARWIDQLPALALAPLDQTASARGRLLFESPEVQCSSCHTGATLTNNQTVDVGTGGLFQVPTLRGLALHAPFMHDGCAVNLTDRFDAPCGGGDQHGKTSQLSSAQVTDLVAYLQTL